MIRRGLICCVATLTVWTCALHGQTRWRLTTESTLLFSRSGPFAPADNVFARTLLTADGGVRADLTSQLTAGASLTGGYDFPNESVLGGVRLQGTTRWGTHELAAEVGVLWSSIEDGAGGTALGVAYYPEIRWAVTAQMLMLPTYPPRADQIPNVVPRRVTDWAVGIRVAERVGLASWVGGALIGLIALVAPTIGPFFRTT